MPQVNEYNRTFEASPKFQYKNPAQILAGGVVGISWEDNTPSSKKYLPFNFTRIINNGEDDIEFYPNQDANSSIYVPKGTIQSIDERTIPALRSFTIKNVGSNNISANKIIITNSREAQSADSIVSRLHRRLFGDKNPDVI